MLQTPKQIKILEKTVDIKQKILLEVKEKNIFTKRKSRLWLIKSLINTIKDVISNSYGDREEI